MGSIGYGYGSEWQLLRYLGRHRSLLDSIIQKETGCGGIEWLDFGFDEDDRSRDEEWKGLGFLRVDSVLQESWRAYWPQGAGIHNWDAVAKCCTSEKAGEWILLEAKANLEELKTTCKASGSESLRKIEAAFDATKAALGVPADANWNSPFYQHCNRIACLHFLLTHGVAARLIFLYFCGDKGNTGRTCPSDPRGWEEAIEELYRHIGLPGMHYLKERIHTIFVHCG